MALLVTMTLLPKWQSWATWALTINRQLSPIVVLWSGSKARWIVTFSRIVLPDADRQAAGLGRNVHVLWQAAQHRALEHVVVVPEDRPFLNDHAAIENASGTDLDAGFHDAERANLDIRSETCGRADDGRWMNDHGNLAAEGAFVRG